MSLTPDDPPAKSRLIIPGAEPESTGRPRIILPPGAVRESADELPEYPRLRRLAILPVRDGEREMLVVQDPMGVMPGQPVLGMEALAILQLLDGTVSLTDISAAVMRESKDLRVGNMVRDFIAQLDSGSYDALKPKPVVTYCTGGIRCEVLTSLMRSRGFDEVYQLDGGIARYGEEYGDDGLWSGSLYVFDGRMTLEFSPASAVIGHCARCGAPTSEVHDVGVGEGRHQAVVCATCAAGG